MTQLNSQIQRIAHSLIILICVGWLFQIGSSIVIPFVFAILLAVFLYPIEKHYSKYFKRNIIAIILSFLTLIIPIIIVMSLFSYQLVTITESLPAITENLQGGIDKVFLIINRAIPFLQIDSTSLLNEEPSSKDLEGPMKFIGQSLLSTTSFLAALGMTILYAFFLLYYKNSFRNFIIYQFEKSARPDIKETLSKIKETIQSYIAGIGLVVIILSVLNSIGLALIGIKFPIFWGVLAGMLAIIPFIGTLLGGFLPFIFALSTADANWQPIAVIIYYVLIQQLEGNFITPKVVGGKVDINPLFALISLIFFGSFWGLGGIVLALPIISVLKIILSNFDNTLSYAVLMSTDIDNKKDIFKKIANH